MEGGGRKADLVEGGGGRKAAYRSWLKTNRKWLKTNRRWWGRGKGPASRVVENSLQAFEGGSKGCALKLVENRPQLVMEGEGRALHVVENRPQLVDGGGEGGEGGERLRIVAG